MKAKITFKERSAIIEEIATETDEISDDLHNELCDHLIDSELMSAWEGNPIP